MKSVMTYIDYRRFLSDYADEMKRKTRYFSARYFAAKAGLSSASFLREVINGKKNLGNVGIEKFILALELSANEARFFRHLVLFNQARVADEKQEHYTILLSLMNTVQELKLTAQQLEVYNRWYIPVIRELVCIMDFRDDFKLLAETVLPSITTSEARSSVRLLERLEMIKKDESGRYRQCCGAVQAKSELNSMAIMNFTKAMSQLAVEALSALPKNERNFSTITCGISRACYAIIEAETNAFRDRIVAIVNSHDHTPDNRVYQFNLQFFPVSRNRGEETS